MESSGKSRAADPIDSVCRFCLTPLERTVVDLGLSPLCQNRVTAQEVDRHEIFYPLKAMVCESCWLVQVHAHVSGDQIFGNEYAYFSSFSDSWLRHCRDYVEMMVGKLSVGKG